jgi:hypothetical protein
MIITNPGRYILTSDYEQQVDHWAIRVILKGTIINVTDVSSPNNVIITQVNSDVLGWTHNDLPVFPYPQVTKDAGDMVWGPAS